MGTAFQFRKVKNSGDGFWWDLYRNMNVLSRHWTVQLNMVKIVCFTLCDVYHNKQTKKAAQEACPWFGVETTVLVTQMVKNLPSSRETQVWSLGWEEPLENGMAIHSSILAWKIPWTEEPGGLEFMGSQRVGHN